MKTMNQHQLTEVQGGLVAFPLLATASLSVPVIGAALGVATVISVIGYTVHTYTAD